VDFDRLILQQVLLFRSQMHMLSLQQHLHAIRDENGNVRFAPGDLRSARFLPELVFQLAIETVLLSDDVRIRMESDPVNLQIAYDALYFLPREVLGRENQWTLTGPEALSRFGDYLAARSASAESARGSAGSVAGQDVFKSDEVSFWHKCVVDLARYLEKPGSMPGKWDDSQKTTRFSSPAWQNYVDQIVKLFAEVSSSMPALISAGTDNSYTWRIDQYFRAVGGGSLVVTGVVEGLEPFEEIQLIEAMVEFLKSISGTAITVPFLSKFHLLSAIPSWPAVQRAIGQIRKAGSSENSDAEAREELRLFVANLKDCGSVLATVLMAAALLGQCRSKLPREKRITQGLDAIVTQFSLRSRPTASIDNELVSRLKELFTLLGTELSMQRFPVLAPRPQGQWVNRTKEQISRLQSTATVDDKIIRTSVEKSWNEWYTRLWNESGDSGKLTLPIPDELVAAAAEQGPSLFLKHDRKSMTLRSWSAAFLGAMSDRPEGDRQHCPIWLAVPALRALGFPGAIVEKLRGYAGNSNKLEFHQRAVSDDERRKLETTSDSSSGKLDGDVPSALIVGTSAIHGWKPIKGYAALALALDEVLQLSQVSKPPGSLLRDFGFRYLVFAVPVKDEDLDVARQIVAAFGQSPSGTSPPRPPQLALVSRDPKAEIPRNLVPEQRLRPIMSPKNLEDLFLKLGGSRPPETNEVGTR